MKLKELSIKMHQGINTVADKVEYLSSGIPIIQSKNINKGYLDLDDVRYLGKDDKDKYSEKYNPQIGDILVSNIGTIGKSHVIDRNEDFLIAWNLFLIKINEKICIPKYVKFYFDSMLKRDAFDRLLSGGTVKFINKDKMGDIEIPMRNINEQEKIVQQLSYLEQIIFKKNEQFKLYDDLIKSRFVEMFGDPILNPKGWDMEYLGDICDVRDGTHDSPKYVTDGFPLVTSKNVSSGYIDFSSVNMISEEDLTAINKRSKVDNGDIIMPMIGTVGNPIIVSTEKIFAIKNVALIKFKEKSLVNNVYIKAVLESEYFENAVSKNKRGGTQKFIALGDIRKFLIQVPRLDYQNEFMSFVQHVDKLKISVQKSLDETQKILDLLMQEYFG